MRRKKSIKLIIVDGLDAVGKDTQANKIAHYYKNKGEHVIIRSHPSNDNYFGKKAKKALYEKGKMGKIKASIFFMFDVLLSIRKYYRPKQKEVLIMVRYLMGTAYLPTKIVKPAYRFFENFVPTSAYMFFLDAPSEELLKRVKRRDHTEIFETFDALEHVRKKALMVAKTWHIIDTSVTIDTTFNNILRVLQTLDSNN